MAASGTIRIFMSAVLIVSLFACTKDRTDHPETGRIASLAPVWLDEVPVGAPIDLEVAVGDYSTRLPQNRAIDNLFTPGRHTLYIYNVAGGITVNGTVATADYDTGIGWFHSGALPIVIERDTDHAFEVEMHQRACVLTLELEIAGDAGDRITGIEGALTGIAKAINIDTGVQTGTPATVPLTFNKSDGKYVASARLLGTVGGSQTLALTFAFADDNPKTYTSTSDLSDRLAAFNDDMTAPLRLTSVLAVTPTEAGLQTSVADWTQGGATVGVAD